MITKNSEILVQILNQLSESVQVCNEHGYFVYCNNRTCDLLGYTIEELKGQHISTIETTFKNQKDWEDHFSQIEKDSLFINKGLHKKKDGSLIPVEASVRSMIYNGEKIALAIVRDITMEHENEKEQKMMLDIMKTSDRITEILLNNENSKESIYQALELLGQTIQVDRVYIFENYRYENQIYSSMTHEWVNTNISTQIENINLKNFPFEYEVSSLFIPLNNGEIINTHVKNMNPDIRPVFEEQEIISLLLIPIRIKEGFWGVIGFDSCSEERLWRQDEISLLKITANTLGMFIEKRESFAKLENMIKEKEILLSELHHRTKNNLAIISGLIDMQINTSMSAETIAYSETIQQRVQNIALIHDLLSSTGNYARLSFYHYTHNLLRRLENMFLNGTTLKKNINIVDFNITDLSQMVSLGILINEILLNSFKHAFQKSKNPELWLSTTISEKGVEIRIKDNGPGFESNNLNNSNLSSIGMKVINGLQRQLRADMKVDTTQGTQYTIKIEKLAIEII